MQNDLIQGLIVMGVGMSTVFAILSIIVVLGKWLIQFLNRYYRPKPVKTPVTGATQDGDDIVVIASIVHQITKGRGQVVNISKPIIKSSNG